MNVTTKVLRWAFVQSFGSKTKVYFDSTIAPAIENLATGKLDVSSLNGILAAGTVAFDGLADKFITDMKVPAIFHDAAKSALESYITSFIKTLAARHGVTAILAHLS